VIKDYVLGCLLDWMDGKFASKNKQNVKRSRDIKHIPFGDDLSWMH